MSHICLSCTGLSQPFARKYHADILHWLALHRHSIAFIMYAFIMWLLYLYTTTGRNAETTHNDNIEMTRTKWYARVPNAEADTRHVIGEDDEE